jgi:hypothetical protein
VLGTMKEAWPGRSEARAVENLKRGGACGWQEGSAGRRKRATGRAMATRRGGRREIREATLRTEVYPQRQKSQISAAGTARTFTAGVAASAGP